MSAIHKNGLKYFMLDCVQDDSLNFIEAKYGLTGYAVVVKLWKKIYSLGGYYCEWSERSLYLFAREYNIDAQLVSEVVRACIEEQIFSPFMLNKFCILTSHGIQKRYLKMCKYAKKTDSEISHDHKILSKIPEESPILPEKTAIFPEESANFRGKEKKSKVNKISKSLYSPDLITKVNPKESIEEPVSPARARKKFFIKPDLTEVEEYFIKKIGAGKMKNPWPEDRCRKQAFLFFHHYESNGWVQKAGKPIVSWHSSVMVWIAHEIDGVFSSQKNDYQQREKTVPRETKHLGIRERDINFLYDRFLDGEQSIINISSDHYNFLKTSGFINFDDETRMVIEKLAQVYVSEESLSTEILTKIKKAFGVLEFFKIKKAANAKEIF